MRKKKNQIEEIQKEFLRKKSLFKCIRWERTEDHPTLQVELTLKRNEKGQIVFSCS